MTRTIKTCAGIGDSIWLMMKLINQPEKFHWQIGDGFPQRGKQLFDLLPQVTESCSYVPNIGYKVVKKYGYKGKWANAPADEFFLQANTHLESGMRIEKFLPDLQTSYILPYVTTSTDYNLTKCIGIYTSAYSTSRHWGGWQANEWVELINLIKPLGYKFVFIGASWDVGIPVEIMQQLNPSDYINTIGEPLPVVVEILKQLDCFIGFPSGLSILNETCGGKKTVMFYPKHLEPIQDAWADPERIQSGQYKGCQFCDPKVIFDWLVENKKI